MAYKYNMYINAKIDKDKINEFKKTIDIIRQNITDMSSDSLNWMSDGLYNFIKEINIDKNDGDIWVLDEYGKWTEEQEIIAFLSPYISKGEVFFVDDLDSDKWGYKFDKNKIYYIKYIRKETKITIPQMLKSSATKEINPEKFNRQIKKLKEIKVVIQ